MDRHGRQTRLVEVGAAGEARLARARVAVPLEGVAGAVAARYLAGAGVGDLRLASSEIAAQARAVDPSVRATVDPVDPALEPSNSTPENPLSLRDPSAAAVALGAHSALVALRRALGVPA